MTWWCLMRADLFFAALVLFAPACHAAIGAATAWEVREAGDDLNGAGFNSGNSTPGTDRSQSDTAHDTGTDLASADGDAVPCVVTSASHNFVDDDEGNLIRIHEAGTGAFTLGYYEIVSTAGNAATLDRACGANGALSGGDWNLGGAANEPEQVTSGVVAGNTVYIKAGTYGSTINTDTAGTGTAPVRWRGYNTTRTDNPTGTDRPLIDCANTLANGIVSDVADQWWQHLRVDDCTGDGITYGGGATFENVKSSNNTDDGWDDTANTGLMCYRCEANGNSSVGFEATSSATASLIQLAGTYIHDNTGAGTGTGAQGAVLFTITESNGGDGIDETGHCINSIAYNNTGASSDGFNESSSNNAFLNCVAINNGRYGFAGTDSYGAFDYNGYNSNGTAGLNVLLAGPNDVTAAPSLTDEANGDFTLEAGSPYLATGFPQAMPGVTGDYQMNIGLDQDDNTAAAATTNVLGLVQ